MTLSARDQQALTARSITGGIIRPDPSGFRLTLADADAGQYRAH